MDALRSLPSSEKISLKINDRFKLAKRFRFSHEAVYRARGRTASISQKSSGPCAPYLGHSAQNNALNAQPEAPPAPSDGAILTAIRRASLWRAVLAASPLAIEVDSALRAQIAPLLGHAAGDLLNVATELTAQPHRVVLAGGALLRGSLRGCRREPKPQCNAGERLINRRRTRAVCIPIN